ncbi:hypothetical protein FOYG_17143 [Fusarium oxysporum NRRL 32931]|uniref:CWH43-like N-terminal domain-containing protein n=1 Tax=Fusarium oxysporum NRRL 32931 TaxID=660029 RepID=W9HFG1_FUSOX|nr:hypothetical protein FOYG_17143 [Fusarium oxysporum NRRL 32931]
MALRDLISYWWLPLLSSVVWFAMLLGMLLHWIIVDHSRRLPTMASTANIAYISNIGATDLQPLFIVGCVLTAVFLNLSFLSERWLRHHGRLVPNTSRAEKILSILSICCAIIGTVGLICLSIFKTGTHTRRCIISFYSCSLVVICFQLYSSATGIGV